MSQNGKGDRCRISDRKKFRDNMDAIFNTNREDKEMPQKMNNMSDSYPKKKKAAKKVTKKKVTKKATPKKKTKKGGY